MFQQVINSVEVMVVQPVVLMVGNQEVPILPMGKGLVGSMEEEVLVGFRVALHLVGLLLDLEVFLVAEDLEAFQEVDVFQEEVVFLGAFLEEVLVVHLAVLVEEAKWATFRRGSAG